MGLYRTRSTRSALRGRITVHVFLHHILHTLLDVLGDSGKIQVQLGFEFGESVTVAMTLGGTRFVFVDLRTALAGLVGAPAKFVLEKPRLKNV